MIHQRSQLLSFCFLLTDLALTTAAWVLAYYLYFESGWFHLEKSVPSFELCWRDVPLLWLLAAVAYRLADQYNVGRLRRFREEMVAVFKGSLLLALLVMATIFFLHDPYESRATILIFWGLSAALVLTGRRTAWAVIRTLRSHGYNQTFSIIVGAGRGARKMARALQRVSWLGMKNIGFVDEQTNRLSGDLDVLGGFADLPELIEKYGVQHVFVALPLDRTDDARRVFAILSRSLVEVRMVCDVPNLAGLSLTTANLDGLPLIGLRESPHFGLNIVFKRGMDIVLSAVGLVVLSPLLALIAVLVKLSSSGPIFYRQERCGLNGRTFHMLKFRSLRVDAEQKTGAVWAVKNDPRRTPLGAFLRRTSLDELPQLWNVLMGDMSLVGPRPERPVFIQQFSKTIPNYMARHCVKAGITGWAQVHGWRGNTSLRKRLQYDLYYITHWTPWLDLRILWMTIFHGFIHRNAY
ncbi:MAG TPA: undecaprenyl-phosphate glucose phosphotransferase [Gemmataceae bacterium]|nr:undecaprenyl-phosphate glucose phosphotransferase [Gemmataceae bacterium]